jgi:hypothetical protein
MHPDPALLRLNLARALAWALLLGGWIGLASLADRFAAGPLPAFGLVASWLLALGLFATLAGRLSLDAWVLRGVLLACALVAARGVHAAVQGGGLAALVPALIAWALLTALASTTVRALRRALGRMPGTPVAAAAAGAAIAWAVVGDAGDLAALAPRLAGLLGAAALLLAALQPSGNAAASGCRAGLFDCSLPAWSRDGWHAPQRWPILLASLGMLPMMCSLPQMLALCRSAALPAQAVLGVHLAAMFVPAWLLGGALAGHGRRAAWACGALLAAGGAAAWLAAPTAWWWLALAHGSAWSLAWAAQLADPALRAERHAPPWRAAAGHALFATLLGAAVAWAGLQAVLGLQLALAAAGALSLVGLALRQHVAEHLEALPGRVRR